MESLLITGRCSCQTACCCIHSSWCLCLLPRAVPCRAPAVLLHQFCCTNRPAPQIPRLYNVYKEQGIIENFEQVNGLARSCCQHLYAGHSISLCQPRPNPALPLPTAAAVQHLHPAVRGDARPQLPPAAPPLPARGEQAVGAGFAGSCGFGQFQPEGLARCEVSQAHCPPQLFAFGLRSGCCLSQVSGFDLVDDESKPERRPNKHMPHPRDWTSKHNPGGCLVRDHGVL